MNMTVTHTLTIPRPMLFDALVNPELIPKCIDGCGPLQPVGKDAYTAQMAMTMAGFRAVVNGQFVIEEKRPPESLIMTIEGRGSPGFVKARSRVTLNERGAQTEVQCLADVQVGGLVASVGTTMIEATIRRLLDDFFVKIAKAASVIS